MCNGQQGDGRLPRAALLGGRCERAPERALVIAAELEQATGADTCGSRLAGSLGDASTRAACNPAPYCARQDCAVLAHELIDLCGEKLHDVSCGNAVV